MEEYPYYRILALLPSIYRNREIDLCILIIGWESMILNIGKPPRHGWLDILTNRKMDAILPFIRCTHGTSLSRGILSYLILKSYGDNDIAINIDGDIIYIEDLSIENISSDIHEIRSLYIELLNIII